MTEARTIGRTPLWVQIVVCLALIAIAAVVWTERDAIGQALGLNAAENERVRRNRNAPVIVATTTSARDDLALEVVGTGRALRSVTLRAETAGLVAEAPILERTAFKQGEPLLSLESRKEALAVSTARTRLADAERTRKRFTRLRRSGSVAGARVDDAATAVRLAKLELDQARAAFADRQVNAPFDGVVGLTDVEIGSWIDSGDAIATFDDRREIIVEFDLPEALLSRIQPGMAVTATTPAVPNQRLAGTVKTLDSRIDAASRSVKVRVAFPNTDDTLRPGASFRVRLELPGGTYVKAPELALQFASRSLYVWRVREGKVERAEVRLVRRLDGAALIEGDVAAGDIVVVEGTQRLSPGKAVRVMKAPDA